MSDPAQLVFDVLIYLSVMFNSLTLLRLGRRNNKYIKPEPAPKKSNTKSPETRASEFWDSLKRGES